MSAQCCGPRPSNGLEGRLLARYRAILWVALLANGAMFLVEVVAGVMAGSVALLADAVDFFGDAANYGISLFVLGMGLAARARASLFKATCMVVFGCWVLGHALWSAIAGGLPDAPTMGVVGGVALVVNLAVAGLLFAFRDGDSNMRSVWLCTRNDALGNVAVLLAALGVFGTGTAWPDLIVAGLMAGLAIWAGVQVIGQARGELADQSLGSPASGR